MLTTYTSLRDSSKKLQVESMNKVTFMYLTVTAFSQSPKQPLTQRVANRESILETNGMRLCERLKIKMHPYLTFLAHKNMGLTVNR